MSAVEDMEAVNTTDRLAELRRLMKEHNVDVYGTLSFNEGASNVGATER